MEKEKVGVEVTGSDPVLVEKVEEDKEIAEIQKQQLCWKEVSEVLQKHGYKIEVNLNFKPL